MSQSFAQNLNQTLQSLEQQAMTKRQLQALLVWFNQSASNTSVLEALLESDDMDSQFSPNLAPIIKETMVLDAAECYQSLIHLTPCDMAKFMLIQEFGPKFKQKPFFQKLVQMVANRI